MLTPISPLLAKKILEYFNEYVAKQPVLRYELSDISSCAADNLIEYVSRIPSYFFALQTSEGRQGIVIGGREEVDELIKSAYCSDRNVTLLYSKGGIDISFDQSNRSEGMDLHLSAWGLLTDLLAEMQREKGGVLYE